MSESHAPLREVIEEAVDHSVGSLLDAHQKIVDANLGRLEEKIVGLQWKWGAALLGGQVVAGLIAAFVTRQPVVEPVTQALARLPFL